MSKGLSLTVLYTSSEDENYPASELTRAHSNAGAAPSKRGWQSAKLCEYPQEIGFRFDGEVDLSQLQILAHQSKTPTKVEVFVASYSGNGDLVPYHRAEFRRLGYLTFHNNEHNKYRSRERKTVQLQEDACYLKLVLHRCHMNPLNLYNQVSLMQVLAFGDVIGALPQGQSTNQTGAALPPIRRGPPPNAAPAQHDDEDVYHLLGHRGGGYSAESRDDPYAGGPGAAYAVPPVAPTKGQGAARAAPQPRKVVVAPPHDHHSAAGQEYSSSPTTYMPPVNEAAAAGSMNGLAYYRSQPIVDFERFYIDKSKELTSQKAVAIETEDFDVAKACKEQLAFIQTNAESIYALESLKLGCIFDEDFDGAKRAKTQMDKLIAHTRQVIAAAKPGKPLRTTTSINDADAGPASYGGGGGGSGAGAAPHGGRAAAHRRRQSAGDDDAGGGGGPIMDPRPPPHHPSDTPNFDEQPVMSKYAQKMAEEARRRQSTQHHEDVDDHHRRQSAAGEARDDSADDDAGDADESERDDGDAAEEQEEDVDDDGTHKRASPPPAPRKEQQSHGARHRQQQHEPRDPDDDDASHHQRDDVDADPQEASAVAPSNGLRFELETFEEWERDVYFAIQDEASRDGTPEAPAEPLETTEGMTDFYSAFGHYTTACLFSRRWKLRDAAIRVVMQFLAVYFKHIITVNAVKAMLKYLDQKGYGLLDTIQTVYLAGCEFIVRLVEGRIPDVELVHVQLQVQALLPRLFFRATDTNPRTREEAITVIFVLAGSSIGPDKVAAVALAETVDQDKRRIPAQNHRAFLSRLTVMQQLLSGHGLAKTVNVDAIMTKLLLPCLNHQSNEVRDLAVVVAGCVDTAKGQEVMKYLPQVRNAATRAVMEEKLAFPAAEGDGAASAEPSPEKEKPKPAPRARSAKKRPAAAGGGTAPATEKPQPEKAAEKPVAEPAA